jgi:hypothetical protein
MTSSRVDLLPVKRIRLTKYCAKTRLHCNLN